MERRAPGHPLLTGGFEPIGMECDQAHLALEGDLPPDLTGTFYRTGPNPQFVPRGRYNPLAGDGMVHAFRIEAGAVSYKNRWVRTRQWALERTAGRALFATSGDPREADPSVAGLPTDGAANTNLVWHAGRLLALEEGHPPIALDPATLETLGVYTFDGALPRNLTAHPKIDPATGEMVAFAAFPTGRATGELGIYVADATGVITRADLIQGPFAAQVHDVVLTRDFIVIPVCPATVDIARIRAGGPPLAWEPERPTHVGVIPRAGGEARWFTRPSCMVWHVLNGFNEGGRITLDVCEQAAAMFPLADGTPPDEAQATQRLARWTLDWDAPGSLAGETLHDERCEYPRIDERRTGLPHRYGYVACKGGPGSGDLFHRGLGRFDHADRSLAIWDAGPRACVGEPVFAPRPGSTEEGDGYILTTVFDESRNASHLAVFDAATLEAGPIARAHLDHRVPMGFHAVWAPDAPPLTLA